MHNDLERQNFLAEVDEENKKFDKFKQDFELELLYRFGLKIEDITDEDQLRQEFESGGKFNDFVEYLGEKHDLDPINGKLI